MHKLYKLIASRSAELIVQEKPTPKVREPRKEVIDAILAYSLKTSPSAGLMN